MSVQVGQLRLRDALKELKRRWARCAEGWDDSAARDFGAEVVDPLESKVLAAIQATGRMQELLTQARRASGADEQRIG
jgi:hypothetical protein